MKKMMKDPKLRVLAMLIILAVRLGYCLEPSPVVHAQTNNYWVKPISGCGEVYETSDGVTLTRMLDDNGQPAFQCSSMGVLGTKAYGTYLLAFVSFPMSNRGNSIQVVKVGADWGFDGPIAPSNLWVVPVSGCGQVYMTTDGINLTEMLDDSGQPAFQCSRMGVLGTKDNVAFVSFPMSKRGNAIQAVYIGSEWGWEGTVPTMAEQSEISGTYSCHNNGHISYDIVFYLNSTEPAVFSGFVEWAPAKRTGDETIGYSTQGTLEFWGNEYPDLIELNATYSDGSIDNFSVDMEQFNCQLLGG